MKTIIQTVEERQLFGGLPAFKNLKTWETWFVVLKATYGLPLNRHERRLFEKHTGRSYNPPPGGYAELIIIVGVQSGKSTMAGVFMGYAALTGQPGTHAIGVCQDHRGAMRVLLRYARQPFEELSLFKEEVLRTTADTLELKNGVCLSAYPCRPQAVRGLRACIMVVDELAFFTSTDGRPIDSEMLRVARGRLATTGGKLIVISSPYGQAGALWDLHRKHYGQEHSSTLVWQASAPDMNPTLPNDYLARMQQDDPDAYRSEVLGEFRTGLSTFLDTEAVQSCVAVGVKEVAPVAGRAYAAFCDPSGGRRDRFTLAIAHAEGDHAVLDAIRFWTPPFNPSGVIAEAAAFLKTYRIHQVQGDRYGGEFPVEQFRLHGVTYTASERDRSAIYLDLLPLINSQRALLLEHPDLLKELRGLERRRGTSGRDRVDHRPGTHDDVANAAAGALTVVAKPQVQPRIRSLATDGPAPRVVYQPGPMERHLKDGYLPWTR